MIKCYLWETEWEKERERLSHKHAQRDSVSHLHTIYSATPNERTKRMTMLCSRYRSILTFFHTRSTHLTLMYTFRLIVSTPFLPCKIFVNRFFFGSVCCLPISHLTRVYTVKLPLGFGQYFCLFIYEEHFLTRLILCRCLYIYFAGIQNFWFYHKSIVLINGKRWWWF